jgi:hypothetical protein
MHQGSEGGSRLILGVEQQAWNSIVCGWEKRLLCDSLRKNGESILPANQLTATTPHDGAAGCRNKRFLHRMRDLFGRNMERVAPSGE